MMANPGRPNPFLDGAPDTVQFLKIVQECNLFNAARESMGTKDGDFSPTQPPASLIHEPDWH
jgi:hypothetical protein